RQVRAGDVGRQDDGVRAGEVRGDGPRRQGLRGGEARELRAGGAAADRAGGLGEGRGQERREERPQGEGGEERGAAREPVWGVSPMSTATQGMTADDLWRLPDDGMRHEL